MLFAAILLAVAGVIAWLSVVNRKHARVYDARFELLGVKTSFGTNHGGLASGYFHRAVRTVASRLGMKLSRKPDDRFTSSQPSYAITVRYRFPTPPTARAQSLAAELVCEDQTLCKVTTLTTRFEVGPRVAGAGNLRQQSRETVACFFLTNAWPATGNCVLRLKYGSNFLADINIGQ